jgi:hypothetical protein
MLYRNSKKEIMNASDEPELNKALEDAMKEKAEKEDQAAKKKLEKIPETVHSDKLYDLMAESAKTQAEILKAIQELKGVSAPGGKKEPEIKTPEKSPEQLAAEKKLLEDEKK